MAFKEEKKAKELKKQKLRLLELQKAQDLAQNEEEKEKLRKKQ